NLDVRVECLKSFRHHAGNHLRAALIHPQLSSDHSLRATIETLPKAVTDHDGAISGGVLGKPPAQQRLNPEHVFETRRDPAALDPDTIGAVASVGSDARS